MNQEYKLSGKAGNLWLTGILIGPLLAILLSILYSYIVVYNPFIYLTILVYAIYLFCIVLVQKLVVRMAKCRSRASSFKYGALVGVFAVYINWCTFLFVLLQRYEDAIPLTEILLNPSEVFHLASSLSVDGWYSLLGFNVSGWFLWLIWIIEILGILAAGILGGSVVLHEKVFCENCNRWVEDIDLDLRLSIEDEDKIHSSIKNDIGLITEIPVVQKDKAAHIKVNIHHCSSCNNLSTVDLDLITLEENDKGEIQENEEDFSPVFLITNEQYKKFIDKKL
ncbi:hypothetical protein OAC51_06120 [Flavobacteriaceae bacterium]|nr:hypothetical protein [Flavobacteriaceae bacterium]